MPSRDDKEIQEIKEPKLLIVEGIDERNFFSALKNDLDLPGIQILDIGGKTQFRGRIKAVRNETDFKKVVSLGIVRDADDNAENAFTSVCDALSEAGLPDPTGIMTPAGSSPQVIVMIVPHGRNTGMLEDVCLDAVAGEPAMSCVDAYFNCLNSHGVPRPTNMSKAKTRVYLASKARPDLRLGEAARASYWQLQHTAFNHLRSFLQSL